MWRGYRWRQETNATKVLERQLRRFIVQHRYKVFQQQKRAALEAAKVPTPVTRQKKEGGLWSYLVKRRNSTEAKRPTTTADAAPATNSGLG